MSSTPDDKDNPFETPPQQLPVVTQALVTGIARPSLRSRLGQDVTGLAGRYRVKGQISRTPASVIYLSFDEDLGRDVAVKVVPAAHAADPLLRQRLAREAHIAAMLDHPNIVPIYDLDLGSDGRLYFSMRLVAGRPLSAAISASPTDEHHIDTIQGRLSVICGIADALTYAHAHNVIHADVSASNIMVGKFGEVLLIDWGSAVLVDGAAGAITDAPPSSTPVDSLYASPEQSRGEAPTMASDQYALAAVAFHLLVGRPPLCRTVGTDLITRKHRGDMDDLDAGERARLPEGLIAVLRKALSPTPGARYASMAEFSAALEPFVRADTGAALARREDPRTAIIILLAICLLALGSFTIWRLVLPAAG